MSITQGVNELTKGKKGMIKLRIFNLIRLRIFPIYLTATPWHLEESPIFNTLIEKSSNNSIMKPALQMKAC